MVKGNRRLVGSGSGPDKLFLAKHCETDKYTISLVSRHVPPVMETRGGWDPAIKQR